ncbi:MAG TPA: diguanylate cyclase [Gaiellaceae bacterium]|jgi:diguanylate cyclase (GGDEF)-like protein/putative nucleotidyltransferase with HDIG domain|nr:diguanylate cyclase [Gaiellaceae bacterium]
MSVVRTEFATARRESAPETTEQGGLSGHAKAYLAAVAVATVIAAFVPLTKVTPGTHGWLTFFVLAACAAVAQLFVVRTPRDQSYHTTNVFLIPAALLLPPELVALMAIALVPEWLKVRYPWYIQSFNICNHTLNGLAAWGAVDLVRTFGWGRQPTMAVAGLVACVVFVATNHVLLATMLHFARGHTLRETGLFSTDSLATDLVLAALGVAFASIWRWNPYLLPTVVAPLLLIHRSLSVPALQEEARVDPKTGLFNARHFAAELREELSRANRFERPMSVIMADLDLLRDINNSYGHLAGDAVLKGIAEVFRRQLRHYDVPARFGGEEFAILLPETGAEQALEIAERIRRAVAEEPFEIETSSEPIRATVSLGVAAYPKDGTDSNELIHQADLAVYRAKLQGRNRVLGASSEPLLMTGERGARLAAVPEEGEYVASASRSLPEQRASEIREAQQQRPHTPGRPHFLALSAPLAVLVALVAIAGIVAGVVGLLLGTTDDLIGLLAIVLLVGGGQALALELEVGSISVSAVGALAGAALFGPRAALPLAIAIVAVEWSARRDDWHYVLFNIGALSLASLAAAAVFSVGWIETPAGELVTAAAGLLAGGAYFVVNTALISLAMALEGHDRWRNVWKERFSWLLPHYVVFGLVGGAIALAYAAIGLYGLAVFILPLLLMRKTMAAYLGHTEKSTKKLRKAAETIQSQNVSLEQANRLLKERSTAAMESLSATVDARDAYTAGHSRRVQQLALAIGRELGLSQAELDLLGHAALFHDIGKLAIPDAILLKPVGLTPDEWALMQRHADEGARIIDRLGFLNDAVPAIRHHHERFDGTGYPDGLAGEDIPLGARIIHVADALDSMLTTRIYRAARPADEALDELRRGSGTQFCPRCVSALERLLHTNPAEQRPSGQLLATA